jgi:hypothetical protein
MGKPEFRPAGIVALKSKAHSVRSKLALICSVVALVAACASTGYVTTSDLTVPKTVTLANSLDPEVPHMRRGSFLFLGNTASRLALPTTPTRWS